MNTVNKEIKDLVQELNQHNINYYVKNVPTISDKEFDIKMKRLEYLEQTYPDKILKESPTQRVGNDLTDGFKKITRKIPMLSLRNTYTVQEVIDFISKIKVDFPTANFATELKFDGVSVSIKYKNGKLEEASTRGNGLVGDDITNNVRAIRNVPLQLVGNYPDELEIRGEVLMSFNSFRDINAKRALLGKEQFSNPRNAVSGTIKSLSPKKVADRNLQCYFYFVENGLNTIDSHWDRLQKLKSFGLPINDYEEQFNTSKEIIDFINQIDTGRISIDVPIDGIVIKVDSYKIHDSIGATSKYPKWAIAYKYDAEEATTQLVYVINQVGKTGIITPVAIFNPVILGNVSIIKATLHNYDFINSLDLHCNDTIVISRGGEVIPKVNKAYRSPISGTKVIPPVLCPICGSSVKHKTGDVGYYCINPTCLGKQLGLFAHFVKPDAMNIKGMGDAVIFALAKAPLSTTIPKLYSLTVTDLSELWLNSTLKLGLKRANLLISEIEKSKQVPFHRVLYALSIPNVGRTASKLLVSKFKSMDNILKASEEDITSINGIGKTVYNSIQSWIKVSENLKLLTDLGVAGLQFYETTDKTASTELQGATYVVTGSFISFSRKELTAKLESLGAKVSGTVSSKTTALLLGVNGGSKLEKALKLKITILNEPEILKLIK